MSLKVPLIGLSASRENLVNNDRKRRCGVDPNGIPWNILFRCVQPRNQLPFGRSSAKLVFRPSGKPPVQGGGIDVEDEDNVKQINEMKEIS